MRWYPVTPPVTPNFHNSLIRCCCTKRKVIKIFDEMKYMACWAEQSEPIIRRIIYSPFNFGIKLPNILNSGFKQ